MHAHAHDWDEDNGHTEEAALSLRRQSGIVPAMKPPKLCPYCGKQA